MSEIDLRDYVASGYFITRYATEGFWKTPLLPERVISVSSCFSKMVYVYWGWDVEKHQAEILDFGIPAEKLPALREWSTGNDVGHPNVFYSLNAAQQFIAEFLPAQDDLLLIGSALPEELVDVFLADNPQTTLDADKQLVISDNPFGMNRVLLAKKSLEAGGKVLGFEIAGYFSSSPNESWLSNGIEKDMHELFAIHPNQVGLINTYEEAKKVYEWIAEDKMQGTRAEPEPYYPWLLVQYPLTTSSGL